MTRVKREWGEAAMLNQAAIRAHELDEVYNVPPKRIGSALWCGIDHQRGYHPDPFWGGLLDVYRMPRYSYYLYKSQYEPSFKLKGIETGPMVYIANEITQASPKDITIYSNCDEVRLTWLGKVVGPIKPDSNFKHMPHPPFVFKNVFDFHEISANWRNRTGEIKLIAEGLINGKVVTTQVRQYAERTTGIHLEIDSAGSALYADGSDFIPVRATVVDNKGVTKVLAVENIHFEVQGAGEIIGSSATQANPMRTQFGTATLLVRATTQPGFIKVTATCPGLKSAEITFSSLKPAMPLWYDPSYTTKKGTTIVNTKENTSVTNSGNDTPEIIQLKETIKHLQLDITSRDQDIMELRSHLIKKRD